MSATDTVSGCVECGQEHNLVQHHTDYPNDITVTVCRSCHQIIHADPSHRLYPVGEPEKTVLRASGGLLDELHDRKDRGDSYEDVIWELIEEASDDNA